MLLFAIAQRFKFGCGFTRHLFHQGSPLEAALLPSVTLAYRAIRQASQLSRLSHPACASTPLAMAIMASRCSCGLLRHDRNEMAHKQMAHVFMAAALP
jgi:hypothetical protein